MALAMGAVFLSSFVRGPGQPPAQHSTRQTAMNDEAMAVVPDLMNRIQKNPQDKEAVLELAEIFNRVEDWPKARQFWTKAIELDPANLGAHYHRGFALMKLEQYAEAVPDYEYIIRSKPEAYLAHYYLAMINKHILNKPDVAKQHLQQALDTKPDDQDLVTEMKKELAELP